MTSARQRLGRASSAAAEQFQESLRQLRAFFVRIARSAGESARRSRTSAGNAARRAGRSMRDTMRSVAAGMRRPRGQRASTQATQQATSTQQP
ncbi:unnamed protein product [Amoebophrya sp. A120]|nr:unnamed protein product [Amoebophrya sp. A120]|eukprot:GSA120T00026026001.1